jgi:hypothetical protein
MPVAIVHSNKSILEAYDVQGTGYKGKIDLLGIGLEQFLVLGEIKSPPKNWKATTSSSDKTPEGTVYLVVLDQTNRGTH